MRSSFAVLGQLAMGELMTDTDVKKSFEGFLRYVDKERMDKALKPR